MLTRKKALLSDGRKEKKQLLNENAPHREKVCGLQSIKETTLAHIFMLQYIYCFDEEKITECVMCVLRIPPRTYTGTTCK